MNKYIDIAITVDLPSPYQKIHLLQHRPGFHLPMHSHTFSHLNFITSGNLTVIFGGKKYSLHEGHAFLLPSKLPHELFSPTGYSQIGVDLTEPENLSVHSDLRSIRKNIAAACPSGFAISKPMYAPCTFQDIYKLLHNLDSFNRFKLINWIDSYVVSFIESNRLSENNNHHQKFIKLISSPSGYNLSLTEMCEKLSLSKTQLERLVNKHFGCSTIEYCRRLKLTRACAFLLDTNFPIAEIADSLGFNSAAHFSYFFKKRMGVTPSTYRNSSLLLAFPQNENHAGSNH